MGKSNTSPRQLAKKFFCHITQHPKTSKRPSVERCRFWTANRRQKNFSSRNLSKLRLWTSPHLPVVSASPCTPIKDVSPGREGGKLSSESVKFELCPSPFGGGGPPTAVVVGAQCTNECILLSQSRHPHHHLRWFSAPRGADIAGTSYIISSFTD